MRNRTHNSSGWRRGIGLLSIATAMAVALPAQDARSSAAVFSVLANLTDGSYSGLAQGTDGNFYGTNGSNFYGTAYQMTPAGTLTTIYNFCSQPNCADGSFPPQAPAALALGVDGNFYGTTTAGGAGDPSICFIGCGTIYQLTPSGALTVLYTICSQPNCADGMGNGSGLVLGPDGNFYGTMPGGGANNNSTHCPYGCGTVFQITPAGAFTTIYNFCSQTNCSDGANPGPLTVGLDGNLYGIASGGGTLGIGVVFKLSLSATLTVLHSFESGNADGACWTGCLAGLVQAPNGNLYGVTASGGRFNPYLNQPDGVMFQVTSSGTYNVVHTFCSLPHCADGYQPEALVYVNAGLLFGITIVGGSTASPCTIYGCGTLFVTSAKGLLPIHYFSGATDGFNPVALIQATSGPLYGVTEAGGSSGQGTIYSLSAPVLKPFIQPVPSFGRVAAQVMILGNNLTGATSVTFNGTAAAFTVLSDTEITATVPAGASSGKVQVVAPTGTLSSNLSFQVLP